MVCLFMWDDPHGGVAPCQYQPGTKYKEIQLLPRLVNTKRLRSMVMITLEILWDTRFNLVWLLLPLSLRRYLWHSFSGKEHETAAKGASHMVSHPTPTPPLLYLPPPLPSQRITLSSCQSLLRLNVILIPPICTQTNIKFTPGPPTD